jgi:shikimate kinase
MTESDPRALVLVGPMGAGKTSIGRKVARTMGLRFADTDKVVVRDHGPIPELFSSIGEPAFRELERAAVEETLAAGGVVALGGGAVLDAGTRAALAGHRVVLLTVSPRVVASRIAGTDRPLLHGDEDPVERWQRILDERMPLYDEVADVTFDTSSGPLSDIVTAIVAWARSTEQGAAEENTKEQA